MSLSQTSRSSRRRFTLVAKVSALLVLAVVIPLFITVLGSRLILRPTLIAQAGTEMETDATAHVKAINSLLISRVQDLNYLSQFFAIQQFLSGDNKYGTQAKEELKLGNRLDPNYGNWTLFNNAGELKLSYPTDSIRRGKYTIPPLILQSLQGVNKSAISDVYFDNQTHMAFVDMYTSITLDNTQIGYGRATLQLNEIWTAVNNENSAGPHSYAMILDGHGVRIAYTNPDTTLTTLPKGLFKPVAPISQAFENRIVNENLYRNDTAEVQALPDPQLADIPNSPLFSFQPALQNEEYQAYQVKCEIVPWTYIVLRPVSTITAAATNQDTYLLLIAIVVTLLAAVVGLVVGRAITRPILDSVSSLTGSSEMLNTLAAREQVTATEQKWIVESSQTALQSVQYYTEATSIAARKLDEIGAELARNWEHSDPQEAQQRLGEIISAAKYIEKVALHQEQSSKSLATAIRIATQVTEQLIAGATSATEAATQLEEVIKQLRNVVGN